MSLRRRAAVALVLAALAGGCDSAPSPAPSPAPSTSPPSEDVDAARLAAAEAAVPLDGLEVREGGERSCAEGTQCLPGTVRSTLYGSEELPERSWEATAGWVREAVEPWAEDGWRIVYSVCAPTRAGTALVKELDADGGPFVALARLDTRDGARTVEVTVPRAEEGADPWEATRTMLPDAACWAGEAPAELVEQSTPPEAAP